MNVRQSVSFALLSSVAAALAVPGLAVAQSAPKDTNASKGKVEEVIVTAQRREERLQTTPVAVSAFSAADLERQHVATAKDLNLSIPNVSVVNNTGTATGLQVYIRGVGQDDSSFTAENKVGLYLDGVYLARELGGLTAMNDLGGVEILRGPQGTLYGRNSAAGAIKYRTARPDFSGFSNRFSATFGSYSRADLSGMVNIPVDDTLAFRVSGASRRQDGYVTLVDAKNVATGQKGDAVDQQTGRLSMLWQPRSEWSVFATLDGFQDNSGPQVITSTNCTGVATAVAPCPLRFGDPYRTANNAPDINRHRQWGTQATVNYSGFTFADVQAITAYRTFTDRLAVDLTGNPAFVLNLIQNLKQKQFSEEVTFTSKGLGPFSWTAGGIYFKEEINQDATYSGAHNLDAQNAESYAGFVEGRYAFGSGVSAFAGIRFTSDNKDLTRAQGVPITAPLVALGTGYYKSEQSSPRAGLEWQVNPDLFLYFTASRGYLPGGFGQPRPTNPIGALATFNAEIAESYEGGARTTFFDNRLVFNVTGFHETDRNLAQGVLTATNFFVVTGNAEFNGAEIEATARPIAGLQIHLVVGALDAKWTTPPPGSGTFLKHNPADNEKVGFDYTFSFPNDRYDVTIGANVTHSADIYRNGANTPNILTKAFTIADAQLGFGPTDGKWRATFLVDNLTDKAYIEQGVSTLGRYYSRPRTFGVRLETRL